jgi:hypothetical protein
MTNLTPAECSDRNQHEWIGVVDDGVYVYYTEFCPVCGLLCQAGHDEFADIVDIPRLPANQLASHAASFTFDDGEWVSNHWLAIENQN